ncbi:MAG: DMT family transporter [Peptococcaceae bacterium]|nr:DMT family transporter [Peptococcaceae bacterium]
MQSKEKKIPLINPYLAVICGVVAVSFSAILIKLSSAPSLVIAFYRLVFTVIFLAPFALNANGRTQLKEMSLQEYLWAFGAGTLLALHFAVWIASLNYTSIASSTVLVTMQPLFVISGASIFFHEKLNYISLFGAGLALLGSIIIGINDFQIGGKAVYGDMLAFAGAIFVAGYILIGRKLRKQISLAPYVFIVYSTAALTLLSFNLLARTPLYPYPALEWVLFVLLAVLPTILGHTVFNWALRYVKAAVVSVSVLGEPVGATILALIIFNEVPQLLQIIGGMLILFGLYTFINSSKKQNSKENNTNHYCESENSPS